MSEILEQRLRKVKALADCAFADWAALDHLRRYGGLTPEGTKSWKAKLEKWKRGDRIAASIMKKMELAMKLINYELPVTWQQGKKFTQTFYSTKMTCEALAVRNVNELINRLVNCGLFAQFGQKLYDVSQANLHEKLFYAGYELCIGQNYYKIVLICRIDEYENSCAYKWYALQPDEAWIEILYQTGGEELISDLGLNTYDDVNLETGEVFVKPKQFRLA